MTVLYRATHYALYGQVALWDAEAADSYPEIITGDEPVTFGERGVVVSTAPDIDVEVVILRGEEHPGRSIGAGTITVGQAGLDIGNLVAADVAHLDVPPGALGLRIYTDTPPDETSAVTIVFD